jgi:hypothetical protein
MAKRQRVQWKEFFRCEKMLKKYDAQMAAFKDDRRTAKFKQLKYAQWHASVEYAATIYSIHSVHVRGLGGDRKPTLRRPFWRKVDLELFDKYAPRGTEELKEIILKRRNVKNRLIDDDSA